MTEILQQLVESKCLSAEDMAQAEKVAEEMNFTLVKVLLAQGYISRKEYYCFLKKEGIEVYYFRDTIGEGDYPFTKQFSLGELLNRYCFPYISDGGKLHLAMADSSDERSILWISERLGERPRIIPAYDVDILWAIHKYFGQELVHEAVYRLVEREPKNSAILTLSSMQWFFSWLIVFGVLSAVIFTPITSLLWINGILSLFFLSSILFKIGVSLLGSREEMTKAVSDEELKRVDTDQLPRYSILLPVLHEDQVIPFLARGIYELDYPNHLKEAQILIEETDSKSLQAMRMLDTPSVLEPVIVPNQSPRTKPKGCNYGLLLATGKYLTIYDAEDIPDADQLKKTVVMFEKMPSEMVCIQSTLNYFNRNQNLLTRMFTLEYSYWFDYMLEGFYVAKLPIPLGGTSNHFRTEKLKELNGWDPFNVTEDADLGFRIYSHGYSIGMIDSTTYEEANAQIGNWIRQRSRWLKGYMQTYFVIMRSPRNFIKLVGWRGFLSFQGMIGGTIFVFMVYPLLLSSTLLYFLLDLQWMEFFFNEWMLFLAIYNFFLGTVLMIYLNMMAVFKRHLFDLLFFAILNPFYWILHSIAVYKGLRQLLFKPFYWEKTTHGFFSRSYN